MAYNVEVCFVPNIKGKFLTTDKYDSELFVSSPQMPLLPP